MISLHKLNNNDTGHESKTNAEFSITFRNYYFIHVNDISETSELYRMSGNRNFMSRIFISFCHLLIFRSIYINKCMYFSKPIFMGATFVI